MKTRIDNLKKYLLVSSVLILAVTMTAGGARYPYSPGLYNINLTSVYVEVLSGNINESALEIEDWMADASYWNNSWIAEASEIEVVIEDWMADASRWNYSWIAEASETEIVIEDWMADPAHWRFSRMHDCVHLNRSADPEKSMRINDWMKDTGRWTTGS